MIRGLSAILICLLSAVMLVSMPVQAADLYVKQYLKVIEPIALPLDAQQTRLFSAADFSAGKQVFESSCVNCHVGGTTLPNPPVSLALSVLKHATPPRDTINQLVAYMRQPMSYDGSTEEMLCRQVPESWLSQPEVENLAAFILRAAQVAPGWATEQF